MGVLYVWALVYIPYPGLYNIIKLTYRAYTMQVKVVKIYVQIRMG